MARQIRRKGLQILFLISTNKMLSDPSVVPDKCQLLSTQAINITSFFLFQNETHLGNYGNSKDSTVDIERSW